MQSVAGGPSGTGGSYDSSVAGSGTEESKGGAADSIEGGSRAVAGSNSAGGSQAAHCDKVVCPSIPTTCKHLTQKPSDCCATCTDTGCDTCPDIDCEPGTHSATTPGDCCPSCVADPPDACLTAQAEYSKFRSQLYEKYSTSSSSNCQNSSDCSLVMEDNSCAFVCNVPLPTLFVPSFASNLKSGAPAGCATCPAPMRSQCDLEAAACVNGKCVAADVERP